MPGTDGTGNALRPQLPGLLQAGFDVRLVRLQMLPIVSAVHLTLQVSGFPPHLMPLPVETFFWVWQDYIHPHDQPIRLGSA